MNTTEIKPEKFYWLIERNGTFNDITGECKGSFSLVEFDDILELDDYIESREVRAGESMGLEFFEVITLYTSWERFLRDVKNTRENEQQ